MADNLTKVTIQVGGMTCGQCEKRIEKAVGELGGVRQVSASAGAGEVRVSYDPGRAALGSLYEAIRRAGYQVLGRTGEAPAAGKKSSGASLYRFLGLIAVVAAVYLIIRYTVGFTFLPQVSQSMGYGLIFVVGLLTSLHCIAMCGGIVLSQGIKKGEASIEPLPGASLPAGSSRPSPFGARLMPSLLYNGGRVLSYTIIGGIVGALGSVFSLSTTLKGVMPVLAGAFMLFLGLRMLGIFPWLSRLKFRLPGVAGRKFSAAAAGRGPFVVGLLSGLMPCGPLQTMQVYALGTGSLLAGALSMFLFSVGTVPLMLGFGLASSLLSARFNARMLKASGVLVLVLGLVMFTRGMSLFGVALPPLQPASSTGIAVAKLTGGGQEVQTTVESGRYHPLLVQAGVPVRWIISVKAEDLNGCNNPLTVPQYGIRKQLAPGDNLIEFTPTESGTIGYTCWMGMISSYIRVVPDLTRVAAADLKPLSPDDLAAALGQSGAGTGSAGAGGGCCGATPDRFAGGKIPVDQIQLARRVGDNQEAQVVVNSEGYTPAVIVLQKGVNAKIRFVAENLDSCNYLVYFPAYQGGLDLSKGRLDTPYLEVIEDFTFECGMGMLHGYVKVVEDINRVDLNAVRKQVAAFKPAPGSASGCGVQ
jgi:copper ion binding protein